MSKFPFAGPAMYVLALFATPSRGAEATPKEILTKTLARYAPSLANVKMIVDTEYAFKGSPFNMSPLDLTRLVTGPLSNVCASCYRPV